MLRIQQLLSEQLNQPVRLKPAQGKAGQDQIYNVRQGRRTIAMVRIQNKYKVIPDFPEKWSFRCRLNLEDRIRNEWAAYEKLSAIGLSPKPLWRNETALACSRIDAKRAARCFVNVRDEFWKLAEKVFEAVRDMHDCGITHMDLNLGNILMSSSGNQIAFIDFEFGPSEGISISQQRVCDYLCLLNEFCRGRRGGKTMLTSPKRMAKILSRYIREEDHDASLGDILPQLARLSQQQKLCHELKAVLFRIS